MSATRMPCPAGHGRLRSRWLDGRLNRRNVAAGCVVVSALASAAPAGAQTIDQILPPDVAGIATEPDVTVIGRQRPAFDSLGVRAGAFMIRPSLTENAGYESNVLGTASPRGSAILQTQGAVSAATSQSRASADASVSFDDVRFTDQPSQSHTDWTARLGGAYSLGRDTLSVQFAHENLSQTLQDLDVSRSLNQALSFHIDDGRISYRSEFARSFVVPSLEVAGYSFNSGLVNGAVYRQDYRNRIVVQPSVTVGYELAPRRNVVAVVRNSTASYSSALPGFAKRDYNDTTVLAGLEYDISGIVRVRALAGYEIRNFRASQYKPITAPTAEASVAWNVTGLTTVTGTVTRSIQDTSDTLSAAATETAAVLRVDHEYLRNLLLQANATLAMDEYRGSVSQKLYSVGAGATYLLNRNMSAGGSYTFSRRDSSSNLNLNIAGLNQTTAGNYSDHRIVFQLRVGL